MTESRQAVPASPSSWFACLGGALTWAAGPTFLVLVFQVQAPLLGPRRVLALALTYVVAAALYMAILLTSSRSSRRQLEGIVRESWRDLLIVVIAMVPFVSTVILPRVRFPVLPAFQPSSRILIAIPLGATPSSFRIRSLHLYTGAEKLRLQDFAAEGQWQASNGGLQLGPRQQGVLSWQGRVGRRATLVVAAAAANRPIEIRWDGDARTLEADGSRIYLGKQFDRPGALLWSVVTAVALSVAGLRFLVRVGAGCWHGRRSSDAAGALEVVALLALAAWTVVAYLKVVGAGIGFEETLALNQAILAGTAPDPDQYRLLSAALIELLYALQPWLSGDAAYHAVFLLVRFAQNLAILSLAHAYFRFWVVDRGRAFLGVVLLVGSMLNAAYQSDFAFSTYFDLVFYLAAGIAVLRRSYGWLLPISVVAALNRETSGLLPVLAIVAAWDDWRSHGDRKPLVISVLSLAIWLVVTLAVRGLLGPRELHVVYGHPPGVPLLIYNLTADTSNMLWWTLGLAPVAGLAVFSLWPRPLKLYAVFMVPAWFGIHAFGSVVSETRLFLVPQAMVFIPACLIFFREVAEHRLGQPQRAEMPTGGGFPRREAPF